MIKVRHYVALVIMLLVTCQSNLVQYILFHLVGLANFFFFFVFILLLLILMFVLYHMLVALVALCHL